MEIEHQRKKTLSHRAARAYGYRQNLLKMDIEYDFKANPFKEKDGKPVLYPAVVVKETITTDHIVKELSKHSAGQFLHYVDGSCLLYTSPSPRDSTSSRMPSSA